MPHVASPAARPSAVLGNLIELPERHFLLVQSRRPPAARPDCLLLRPTLRSERLPDGRVEEMGCSSRSFQISPLSVRRRSDTDASPRRACAASEVSKTLGVISWRRECSKSLSCPLSLG